MVLPRVLEPEVMDTWEESIAYDAMDFTEVNTSFAREAVELGPEAGLVLDAGTGTARIPILLCQLRSHWNIVGIDLSENMLKIGATNIDRADLKDRIQLQRVDVKKMPYPDNGFDMVISNTIVHHLPDPMPFWCELRRVLKPGGGILVRDLLRPESDRAVEALVSSIGTDYDPHQAKLFRDSLYAAFTLEEVTEMVDRAGLEGVRIYQSSDRHWTLSRSV